MHMGQGEHCLSRLTAFGHHLLIFIHTINAQMPTDEDQNKQISQRLKFIRDGAQNAASRVQSSEINWKGSRSLTWYGCDHLPYLKPVGRVCDTT